MSALQTERMFRVHELLDARGFARFEDLRQALNVSRATLKRDLAFMRDRLNAPIVFDRDAGGYRYARRGCGPRFELVRPSNRMLLASLQRVVAVMERCEPDIDDVDRATENEWIAALADAKATLHFAAHRTP